MIENIDWTRWSDILGTLGPRLAVLLLILVGGVLAARLAQSMILRWGQALRIADIQWVGSITRWGILIATGLVALQHMGVDVGLLTTLMAVVSGAIVGSVSLALALGGKNIVGDILGAYYLKKLFHPGQTLRLAGQEGVITEITPTGLVLENEEGQVHISGGSAFEGVIVRLRDNK